MPVDISVEGAEQFRALARHLRDVGDKDLRKELYRGIERATKPLKQAAKESAAENLPRSGGLARDVAASRFSTRKRAGRDPGISIRATGKRVSDVRALDRGRLRHPVFGNRGVWVTQTVRPGWFTEAIDDKAAVVREELLQVFDALTRQLASMRLPRG